MKNILLLFLIFFVITSCSNTNNKNKEINQTSGYLITSHSAGQFKIGEDIPDTLKYFNIQQNVEKRYTDSGPEKHPVYGILKNGSQVLVLYPEYNPHTNTFNQNIDEIIATSPLFKTKKGIAVGSKIQEFITTYPDYSLWYTYVSDRYVLENQQKGIQFLLKEEDFTGKIGMIKNEKTMLEPADFAENTEIYKIRIY